MACEYIHSPSSTVTLLASPALNRGMGIDLVTISYVKGALEVTIFQKREINIIIGLLSPY